MRLLTLTLFVAPLLLSSCKARPARMDCPPGALGAEAFDRGLVLLGEIHGAEEPPAVALATACGAARAAGGAWLGLEIPRDEQARIDAYLTDGNEAVLLDSPWWTREAQDGRTSRAFLKLLVTARALRQSGVQLELVAFDVPYGSSFNGRDEAMAGAIATAHTAKAGRPGVVLVGNIHAMRKLQLPKPLAWFLAAKELQFLTLNMASPGGNAWTCGRTCGPSPMGAMGPMVPKPASGFTLEAPDKGFDGWWFAEALTPSLPAVARSLE